MDWSNPANPHFLYETLGVHGSYLPFFKDFLEGDSWISPPGPRMRMLAPHHQNNGAGIFEDWGSDPLNLHLLLAGAISKVYPPITGQMVVYLGWPPWLFNYPPFKEPLKKRIDPINTNINSHVMQGVCGVEKILRVPSEGSSHCFPYDPKRFTNILSGQSVFLENHHLEPETTIYTWLFQLDDSKSWYGKWLFHHFHPFINGCLGLQAGNSQ